MKSRPDLDFLVAGGARYGLGHIMRSGTLAASARRRGWRVRAFLAGDRVALERWRASCPDSEVLAWSAWRARESAPLTVFDHPFAKSRWLEACRRDRTRTIVLDDSRAIGRARLTIQPALHHLAEADDESGGDLPEDDPATLVLRGPRYALLGSAHLDTPHRPQVEREALLLSIGGADPHAVTPRIAPLLAEVLDRSAAPTPITTRRVILGPAFPDPDRRIASELAAAGWEVERALEPAAMARRMAEARIAVMGFGTSLCELAWHETPHLSVTHHDHDVTWAKTLEERGIGRFLGRAAALDPERVKTRFAGALADPDWQRTSAQRALAAIDGGRGCDHILDRLALVAREIPLSRPASGLRRQTGRSGSPLA
ncbi:MAG: hypothetical protein IPK00_00685 [Deltaproteobacteria bacterium]|nr:hypothetical protein [Deltaproteobacteria bacterium]